MTPPSVRYDDLRALFINCTLKRSPEPSHTQGLVDLSTAIMRKHGVHDYPDPIRETDPSLPSVKHYEAARKAGALGGKLMGAGGGGFFMFYARPSDRRRLVDAMKARDLRILKFRFDVDGARIALNSHRS